jgi:preprotein translocase subunit SecA
LALNDGKLAEMATGEGKTLVALLPAYLNSLSGKGVYVVTTNDYLAKRDGENVGQVLKFLGLSVGIIQSYQKEIQRREAYKRDVTYLSNQELGFDFLRDNLAMSIDNVVQEKPYNFCIIDEADSILIDEAKTPLIISRRGNPATEKYLTSAQIVKNLNIKVHYEVNLKDQKVELTAAGYKFVEQILNKNLFDLNDPWAFYIISAIKAKELFTLNKDYIISNNAVAIIDSFSGRVLEGRRFTDGIQQSLEAKENIKITSETQTVAKVTYQNLFRLFPKISGMTGTAMTEALEFLDVYSLPVIQIPTALPVARRDNDDAVFRTKDGKLKAMLRNLLSVHEKGRPILIGTTSIEYSEELFSALKDLDISAKVSRSINILKISIWILVIQSFLTN